MANLQQGNQELNYRDGNSQYNFQQSTQSWQSYSHTPIVSSAPQPILQAPTIPVHMQLHGVGQQMHNAAMAHHQIALGYQSQFVNGMQNSMAFLNSTPGTPAAVHSPAQMSPTGYVMQRQAPQALQYVQQPAMQITAPQNDDESSSEDESEDGDDDDEQLKSMQSRYQAEKEAIQRRFETDRAEILQRGAKLEERMQKLESQESKSRKEQENKERELQRLREENVQMNRQRLEDVALHNKQMAELMHNQQMKSQPQTPAFDMSVMEKMVQDIQAKQLSSADVERVIEATVAKKLAGLASRTDIEAAGLNVQKALGSIPLGASTEQMSRAVGLELERVAEKIARKGSTITQRTLDHRALDPDLAQAWQPLTQYKQRGDDRNSLDRHWSRSRPASLILGPQPTNGAPELPLHTSIVESHVPSMAYKASQSAPSLAQKGKQRALPPLEPAGRSAVPIQTQQETLPAKTEKKKALSVAPVSLNALTRADKPESKKAKSTFSILPGATNTLATPGQQQRFSSAADAMAAATAHGGQISPYGGHQAIAELPEDFPDNASQITAWERRQASSSVVKDGKTVAALRPRNDRRVEGTPLSRLVEDDERDPSKSAVTCPK